MGSSPITASTLDLSGTSFGLGQGLNVQSVVQSLTTAAQAGETVYTNEQTLYSSQISDLQSVSNLLTTLQTATQALQDPAGALSARDANSSNSSVVTATANSGVSTGNYSIVVGNLASTAILTSQPQNSATAAVGAGTIQYTIGSNNYTINVGASDTLTSLVSSINNGNYGVTASIVNDSAGSFLTLTSNTAGGAGEITNLTDSSGLGLSTAVHGKDASLSVNGVPITESTNTVTGVIPGVTLDLQGTSASPVTVSVTPDVTQATTAINNFVSAYNAVANAMNTEFTYTAGASSQPPLFSDSALQQVQSTLASDINYFTSGNIGINGLSSLGVNLQQDGTLSVDSATLTAALSSNSTAVQNFFQGADLVSGFGGQLYNDINKLNDPTQGVLALDLQGIDREQQDVTNTISDFNANLLIQEQQWTTEYSQVNATLEELPSLIQQAGGQISSTSSSSTTA
jgi:flagellar hook-associated protein 2